MSVCFLNSIAQSDSIKNKFTVGVSPFLYVYPFEDGFYFEYQPKQRISFELGGGLYNLIKHPLNDCGTSGFTIRAATKIYSTRDNNHCLYYEFLAFYRQVKYVNEYFPYDDWVWEGNVDLAQAKLSVTGNDLKHTVCIEGIFGSRYILGRSEHWVIEPYLGCGLRMRIHNFSIKEEYDYGSTTYYSPPRNKNYSSFVPSLHTGVKFGYSF